MELKVPTARYGEQLLLQPTYKELRTCLLEKPATSKCSIDLTWLQKLRRGTKSAQSILNLPAGCQWNEREVRDEPIIFRGIYRIYLKLVKTKPKDQLDLETSGFWPIMLKNLPRYYIFYKGALEAARKAISWSWVHWIMSILVHEVAFRGLGKRTPSKEHKPLFSVSSI